MICPKCGKDAGDAKICPACGEALPASADKKKPGGKKGLIIGAVVAVVAVVVIILCVAQKAKPAEYVSWPTLYSAFSESIGDAERQYGKKMLKFYVRIDEIAENGAYVTCYDENWNEVTDVPITQARVAFATVSGVEIGGKYVIEGKISKVLLDKETGFDPVEITNAKILDTTK